MEASHAVPVVCFNDRAGRPLPLRQVLHDLQGQINVKLCAGRLVYCPYLPEACDVSLASSNVSAEAKTFQLQHRRPILGWPLAVGGAVRFLAYAHD